MLDRQIDRTGIQVVLFVHMRMFESERVRTRHKAINLPIYIYIYDTVAYRQTGR